MFLLRQQGYNHNHFFLLTASILLAIFCIMVLRQKPVKKSSVLNNNTHNGHNLFCFTMTASANHDTQVPAQNDTWIKRCDQHYFFSNAPMKPGFKHSVVHNFSKRSTMWKKFRVILPYIYLNVSNSFDWYLRTDDNTFMIVENLRRFLEPYDPNERHFFGFHFKPELRKCFMSGPAMVFSRGTMKLLIKQVIPDLAKCPIELANSRSNRFDDFAVSRCLAAFGVYPEYTRDTNGRERFHPWHPNEMYEGARNQRINFKLWSKYPAKTGFDAFSEQLISSHHLTPMEMRLFEILLYRVKVSDVV